MTAVAPPFVTPLVSSASGSESESELESIKNPESESESESEHHDSTTTPKPCKQLKCKDGKPMCGSLTRCRYHGRYPWYRCHCRSNPKTKGLLHHAFPASSFLLQTLRGVAKGVAH